jgi:hypothetical protein
MHYTNSQARSHQYKIRGWWPIIHTSQSRVDATITGDFAICYALLRTSIICHRRISEVSTCIVRGRRLLLDMVPPERSSVLVWQIRCHGGRRCRVQSYGRLKHSCSTCPLMLTPSPSAKNCKKLPEEHTCSHGQGWAVAECIIIQSIC